MRLQTLRPSSLLTDGRTGTTAPARPSRLLVVGRAGITRPSRLLVVGCATTIPPSFLQVVGRAGTTPPYQGGAIVGFEAGFPSGQLDNPAGDGEATGPWKHDDFIVIPLRVHILSAKDLPEIDCHLSDGDITRILAKANRIWHQAGIHWGLEKLVREPAARTDRFLRARDLRGEDDLGAYRILFPDNSRGDAATNVYFIHEFSVNGVWLRSAAVVKETAQLKKVPGGIDEPIPRVLAHELGHALSLPHRENRTNLMASGTTGTPLNAAEARAAAQQPEICLRRARRRNP